MATFVPYYHIFSPGEKKNRFKIKLIIFIEEKCIFKTPCIIVLNKIIGLNDSVKFAVLTPSTEQQTETAEVGLVFFPLLRLNGCFPLYLSMEKSNQRKTLPLWAWFQQIFLSSATRCFKLFHWTHTEPRAVGLQPHTDKRAAGLLKFIRMRQVIRSNYETVSWFSCCY